MSDRRRHTVVLSDVHLSQAHPHDEADPFWMRYRRSEYHPDADFEGFVASLLEACKGEPIEVVFNGDVLDFDAPLVKGGTSTFDEFPLDDAGCAEQLRRIVADHPRFFGAAARLLAEGHRVIFLSGNHDLELYWPGVRSALREELRTMAAALSPGCDLSDLEERVRFRAWFHVTEDKVYLEHGSQYDHLNGVPDPMAPVIPDGSWLHPVAGKLAFKRTGSRMGYFNPYYEETFYMGASGYLRHFVANYMFSDRHIVRTWMSGAVATVREIIKHRRRGEHELSPASIEHAMRETGASREAVLATHALRVPSGERTMIPILRELWLDRIGLALVVLTISSLAFALASTLVAGVVVGVLVLAFVVYELVTPKPDIRTYDMAPPTVKQIFDIHGVKAMCMGHTHRPVGSWEGDRFWGNSGSWCPAFVDRECTKPVLDGRPFLWLTADDGTLGGGLHWFRNGAISADPEGTRAPRLVATSSPR
jgi:UDP-2,3-diacylglucosamine pyrophosphatase LpxH